jgi:ABC-type antimicrobial peptide transport system permease subunit
MKLSRAIRISFRQLQINRARSIFAIIALSIGIAAVIVMAAIGNGAKIATISQLEQMGTNLITVNSGKVRNVMERKDKTDRVTTLKLKDCEAILDQCSSVSEVVPSLDGTVKVKYGSTATLSMINGVSAPYFSIRKFDILSGDLFTSEDNKLSRCVAVLGNQVSQSLFGNDDPIGEIILAGKVPFTVIGVLRSKGINGEGANLDAQVIIPINTAMRRIFNKNYVNHIFIEVNNRPEMKLAENEIISILRETHRLDIREKENDFTLDNQLTAIEASEDSARSFTWLIVAVSGIALLIGGTGILAVMLLSVRARNSEIGLRLSLGAKRRDIVRQFTMESSMLGFAGGLAGISLAMIITGILKATSTWEISISSASVFISLLFSVFIGLCFGVIPARKASQANPIEALQKE